MATYLSPGVYTKETDLTNTIPSVATSVAVNVLRQTYKGIEFSPFYVSNEDQLISEFGKPTNTSYRDILSSIGYLKFGRSLYCVRVMPEDATFAGISILEDYSNYYLDLSAPYTFFVSSAYHNGTPEYDYISLGTTDLSEFPSIVSTIISSNESLRFIAKSRGQWGNNIRLVIADYDFFNSVKYFNETTKNVDLPSGMSITTEALSAVAKMFNDYEQDGAPNSYPILKNISTAINEDKHFLVLIQAIDQGESEWETKEYFIVSTKETDLDDSGSSMFVETVINEQSKYVWVALNPSLKSDSEFDNGRIRIGTTSPVILKDGHNGEFGRHDSINSSEAEDSLVVKAYELFSNPEEVDVNIFIDSDKGVTVKQKLIEICTDIRKDCMCVLDVPRNLVINNFGREALDLVRWRKGQSSNFNPNTSYAALYGNWIEIHDKWNKKYRWIPASGHVTGLYANTDNVSDPWFAPAGLNRTILSGVRRLAWNPQLGERDLLYKSGINPIVSFAGQGKVIWGQKTLLDKESAFNRINVRRLFLVLEKSISKASKYFLFEQNDDVTWMLMRNMIEPFLRDVKGRRGVYDFMVQIDESTNTPERIDRQELWGNIWIKPTRSAEFIILNFIATKTGASFDELISSGVA